jgi:hypothetical protein
VKTGNRDITIAFNARNGREVWRFPNGKYAGPVIADQDRVYLTGRSFLYGLQPVKAGAKAAGAKKRSAKAKRAARKKKR